VIYLWFDAEFTSLELETAGLLQVAAMATDANLQRILPADQDLNLFIQPEAGQEISPWVLENIPQIVEKANHPDAISIAEADQTLAAYVEAVMAQADSEHPPLLAGNSIHNDWHLARRLLPTFMSKLHYPLLDVSTVKTLHAAAGNEVPEKDEAFVTTHFPAAVIADDAAAHDAYYDIQASAAELAYYQSLAQ